LIAGNQTPIDHGFWSGQFLPVSYPRAGFLLRISPDFSQREVVAHGFRNAYGFDFNDRDQIFVYDSDDEREVGMPWYRPTRLFQVQPGDDAGWFNDGWKRPSYDFDMPVEIGAVGRGSPTGVVCYRGSSFPPEYNQAIFFADWTFGRIWVARFDPITKTYQAPTEFAKSIPPFAFAVTDLIVDAEGSLLASVGGRQTSGAIYKISYSGNTLHERSHQSYQPDRLQQLARKRGELSRDELGQLLEAVRSDVEPATEALANQRRVLQILQGRHSQLSQAQELHSQIGETLSNCLTDFDPTVLKLFNNLGGHLDHRILQLIDQHSIHRSARFLVQAMLIDDSADLMNLAMQIVDEIPDLLNAESSASEAEVLAMCRLVAIALSDFGQANCDMALRGYTFNENFEWTDIQKEQLAHDIAISIQLAERRNFGNALVELGRLAALMQLQNEAIREILFGQLVSAEESVDKLHWLFCLSQTGLSSDLESISQVAQTLYELNRRVQGDRNWEPRLIELVSALVQQSPELAEQLLHGFSGSDEQLFILPCLPYEYRIIAIARLANSLDVSAHQVTEPQLRAIFESQTLEYQSMFRVAATIPHLADLSILALTRLPEEQNRPFYREGLKSRNMTVVKNSAIALRRLTNPIEHVDLKEAFATARRLAWNEQHVSVRDQLMMLFESSLVQQAGYQFKRPQLVQSEALGRLHTQLANQFPDDFDEITEYQFDWRVKYSQADWAAGNADRGKRLYTDLKCDQCHQGSKANGPSLEGVTRRFSRDDIFRIIAQPSDRISDRYRAKLILTNDGNLLVGIPIYESIDGITIQDADGTTLRINRDEIESIRISDQSMMPTGLLDELSPEQFADLGAFLESLR
jgi:putative heme-binding domain-containing protein